MYDIDSSLGFVVRLTQSFWVVTNKLHVSRIAVATAVTTRALVRKSIEGGIKILSFESCCRRSTSTGIE